MENKPNKQLFDNQLSVYLFIVLGVVLLQALILSYLANQVIDFRLLLSAAMSVLTVALLTIIIFSPLAKTRQFIDFQTQRIKEIAEKSQNDLQTAQQNFQFLSQQHQKSQQLLVDYTQNTDLESICRYATQLLDASGLSLWAFEQNELKTIFAFRENKILQVADNVPFSLAQFNELPKFVARNFNHSSLQNFVLKKHLQLPAGILVGLNGKESQHLLVLFEYQNARILSQNQEQTAAYLASAIVLDKKIKNTIQNSNFLSQKNTLIRKAIRNQEIGMAIFVLHTPLQEINKEAAFHILENPNTIYLEEYSNGFLKNLGYHHLADSTNLSDFFEKMAYPKLLPKFFENKVQNLLEEVILENSQEEKRYFSIFLSPILENQQLIGWVHWQQDITNLVVSGEEQSNKLRKSRAYQKILQKLAEADGEKFWQNTPLLSETLEQIAHVVGFSQTSFWKVQNETIQSFLKYKHEFRQVSAIQEKLILPFSLDEYKYQVLYNDNLENLDLSNFDSLYKEKFGQKSWLLLPIHLQNKAVMLFLGESEKTIFLNDETRSLLTSFARQLGTFLQNRQSRLEADFLKYKTETHKNYLQSFGYGVAIFELKQPISLDLPYEQQVEALCEAFVADCNPALEKMMGLEKDSILNKKMQFFPFKNNPDDTQQLIGKIVEKAYKLSDTENFEVDTEGQKVQYLKNFTCLIKQNQLKGIWYEQHAIGILNEETQAKFESEERLRLLAESQEAISILLSEQGEWLYFPNSFARKFGYQANEIARKQLSDFLPAEQWQKIWDEVLSNPSFSMTYKTQFLKGNGTWAWVKLDFYYQSYKGIAVNISDITEQTEWQNAAFRRERRWEQLGKVQKEWAIIDDTKKVVFANEHFAKRKTENFIDVLLDSEKENFEIFLENLPQKNTIILRLSNQKRHVLTAFDLRENEFVNGIYVLLDDIENELAEKERLFHKSEFFESLAQTTQQAWGLLDEKGNFVYVNPIFSSITEFESNEIQKKNIFELAAAESFGESLKVFEKVFAEKNTQSASLYLQTKTEKKIFVEAYFSYLLDNQEVRGVLFEFRELTSQKEIFDKLADNEQRLRVLSDSSHQMLGLATDYGKWLYQNREAAWLAYSQKEWTMPFDEAIVHPESVHAARQMWQKALAGDTVSEILRLNRNGNWTEIKCHLQSIRTEGKNFLVADFEDISEKIWQQGEIVWLHEQIENLTKNNAEELQKQDQEAKWQIAQQKADFEQVLNNKEADLQLTKQTNQEKVQTILHQHEQNIADLQAQKTALLEKLEKDKNLIISSLEEKIDQLYQSLRFSEQSAVLGRQIASISDSLHLPLQETARRFEPLRFYLNDLEELLNKYQEISPDVSLAEKLQEINYLKEIIGYSDLFSRSYQVLENQVNRIHLSSQTADYLKKLAFLSDQKQAILLSDLLEIVIHILAKKLEKIELVKKYAQQKPIEVSPAQIAQVFIHLLSNAAEAMPEGGYLFITILEQAEKVFVSIKDTGIGIATEIEQKIGLPFVSSKAEHLGLGLFFSKKIMENHHAQLFVKAQNKDGTECSLVFNTK